MDDLVLTFGKHRGKKLSQVEPTYLEWLSKAAFSENMRKAAGEWFQASLTEQEREYDREWNRDLKEYAQHLSDAVVAWEAGGHQIEVRPAEGMRDFAVFIDGERREYDVDAIKPCSVPGRPEIVARLGKAGLTEERREAVLKLLDF